MVDRIDRSVYFFHKETEGEKMKFSENLIQLRKTRGWSQEELGYKLDVSRQTVSKWEMGETTPEMRKLIKLAEIFEISIDSLVGEEKKLNEKEFFTSYKREGYEYKSKREIRGIPLIHINLGRGMRKAIGIIAIGNISMGLISFGLLSAGFLSIGLLSFGLLAFGSLAVGGVAAGGFAGGYLAMGGIAAGYLALGGVAIGQFAVGGVSLAQNIAIGGVAEGYIAIGDSVKGTIEFATNSGMKDIDWQEVRRAVERTFPDLPKWIKALIL